MNARFRILSPPSRFLNNSEILKIHESHHKFPLWEHRNLYPTYTSVSAITEAYLSIQPFQIFCQYGCQQYWLIAFVVSEFFFYFLLANNWIDHHWRSLHLTMVARKDLEDNSLLLFPRRDMYELPQQALWWFTILFHGRMANRRGQGGCRL